MTELKKERENIKPTSEKKAQLVEGPVGNTLVKLTIPMILGIVAIMAFNLTDTFFVGQLGTVQLAAMSFTFPVVFVIGSIAMGLGMGASAVISRAIGEGDHSRVQRFTTDSLTLSLIIVIAFITAGMLTIEPLFKLLGATREILPHIKKYMTIWYPGVAFLVIPMVGNNAIRATGDTKTPSMIMMLAVAVNIALDPLLIFGLGPFPRWELAGAATATVFSRAVTMTVSLWILGRREKMITLAIPKFKEGWESWKKILYIGVPAAGTNLILPISMGVITRMVAVYGPAGVAALGVATRLEGLALTVDMALGSVLIPFVGQNWGAGFMPRIRLAVKYSNVFAMIWGAITFVLFFFLARPIAGLFNENPTVIDAIVSYLLMVSISYGFLGIVMLSGSVFNALNRPLPSASLSLLRMAILYIPLAVIGAHYWQLKGIFAAATVANVIAGIIALIWMRKTLRKHA